MSLYFENAPATAGLSAFLFHRAEQLKANRTPVLPAVISDHADRWLLASLLQKAFRRDQPQLALACALKLLELDPARLWRRLMTLALEDVGVGCLEVSLELLAVACLPTARKLLGGSQQSLHILVPLACRAIKDRTADHLASLTRATVQQPNRQDRRQEAVMPCARFKAWGDQHELAAGFASGWETKAISSEDILAHFAAKGAPSALIEGCRIYARRVRNSLFIHALTAWQIWHQAAPEAIALARTDLEGHALAGLADYALDPLHTRLGRRAIELWLRAYLQKPPFNFGQVAAGLWNQESATCHQTLFWATGGEVQRAAYAADLCAQGLRTERHPELMAWIASERSVLLCARQMAWKSHLRDCNEGGVR